MNRATHTAYVEPQDRAVVRVRLFDERPPRPSRLGHVLITDCEMRPSAWRELRHVLAVGLACTGGHLAVVTSHSA